MRSIHTGSFLYVKWILKECIYHLIPFKDIIQLGSVLNMWEWTEASQREDKHLRVFVIPFSEDPVKHELHARLLSHLIMYNVFLIFPGILKLKSQSGIHIQCKYNTFQFWNVLFCLQILHIQWCWMVLVQGLSWGCIKDVSQENRYLKSWLLGLKNLLPKWWRREK